MSQMYAHYGGVGPTPALIGPALCLNLVALTGVVLNSFVVYCIVRHKSLRGSSTNYLLALHCACELLHQTAPLTFGAVALSGLNFIPYQTSMYFQMPAIFGIHSALIAIPAIAVDRLALILLPIRHKNLRLKYYIPIHVGVSTLFGVYATYNAYSNMPAFRDRLVTGHFNDVFVGTMGDLFFHAALVLNGLAILCYLLVGVAVYASQRASQSTVQQNQASNRIFKSLLAIMLVVLVGYTNNTILRTFVFPLFPSLNEFHLWFLSFFLIDMVVNLAAAANMPILYTFSTEHRTVFQVELRRIFGERAIFMPKESKTPVAILSTASRRNTVLSIATTVVVANMRVIADEGNSHNCIASE